MEKLRPQLLRSLADYSREKLMKDLIAGVIVAIIALPLSIALALASGVSPEQGLYTAIVAGFLVSALGGSKVQIAGPTAAFAAIVAGIVARNGMDGLAVATILAGILLVLMGLLRMGSMIKFIPYTIEKVKAVRRLCDERGLTTDIQVDGGISAANVREVLEAGANIFVAGSAVFGTDPAARTREMVEIFKEYEK